tara:strand:+ start:6925 stop:7842 length:918 start_codon:yes stop_codon:yes gene_type:complete
MKSNISKFLSLFSLIIICFYLINNPSSYEALIKINTRTIIIIVSVKFFTLLLNSLFNFELLKVFRLKLGIFEAIYLSSLTFVGNFYLPGKSGASLRLLYLNKKYNFKSPELTSIFFYFVFITTFLSSFFGLISLLLINNRNVILKIGSLSILSIIFISSFYILKKNYALKNFPKSKISQWVNETKKNWNILSSEQNLLLKLVTITGVNFFLFATEIAIIFNYLFKDLAILEILYYNSLSVFSSLLSITPASLGIKEFIILISNDLLGVSLENLISVLIIERAISIVFSIIPLFFIFVNSLTQKPN